MSESSSARVRKHRERLDETGYSRIEVRVPTAYAAEIRDYAERLRRRARRGDIAEMRTLIREAYDRFRSRCLDNIDVDSDKATARQARVVARALMERGDDEAFRLGRRILAKAGA